MEYEYKVQLLSDDTDLNQKYLNEIGKDEWELLAIDMGMAYFKREAREYKKQRIRYETKLMMADYK